MLIYFYSFRIVAAVPTHIYYSVCVCACVSTKTLPVLCCYAILSKLFMKLFFNFSKRWQGRFWLRSNIYTGGYKVKSARTRQTPDPALPLLRLCRLSFCLLIGLAKSFICSCLLPWQKMLLLTPLANGGARENDAARLASECERERAAAACDERRCCCSATAGAVKLCKAERVDVAGEQQCC